MSSRIKDYFGFVRFVATRFTEDRCSQVAASLTYTTLLALVPMITIALTLISAFPVFQRFVLAGKTFILANLMPDAASHVVTDYMGEFSANAAGLTLLGIVLLAITALMLLFTIGNAFNAIWRARRPRPLWHRMIIYFAMLTLGPVLVGASITLTSYLVVLSKGWVEQVPAADNLLVRLVPTALTTMAFTLLYLIVPNRSVRTTHAFIGGLVAAIVFELTKRGVAAYVASVPTYSLVYGAFASFPIFLLWLYCSWVVILLGAEITAALPYWQGGVWRIRATPRQRFHDALRILRVLNEARPSGKPVKQAPLRAAAPMALENMEDLLERLVAARMVRGDAGAGYALADRPDAIRLADIYRLFVLEDDIDSTVVGSDGELAGLMEKISADVEGTLGQTLDAALAPAAQEQAVSDERLPGHVAK
jgi:membrane protein